MIWLQQYIIPVMLGIGLSASCGLRVFLPLFSLSVIGLTGGIQLASGFEWLSSWPALIVFGSASMVEVITYYIPWLDNMLDTVSIPSSVAAGTLILASANPELESTARWTLALIAGGGTAGLISAGTSILRVKSTLVSGGATNFLVATFETIGSVFMLLLSLLVPVIAGILVLLLLYTVIRLIIQRKKTV